MRVPHATAVLGVAACLAVVTLGASSGPVCQVAQSSARPEDVVVGRYVRVHLDRDTRPPVPGTTISLFADVLPGPKMHVYAPGQDGYIAVDLTTTPAAAFKALQPTYPAPRNFYFEPLRETVKVFDQPFRITQEISIAATPDLRRRAASRAPLAVTASLTYQACDDAVCYRPETLTLTWTVPLQPK